MIQEKNRLKSLAAYMTDVSVCVCAFVGCVPMNE